MEKPVYTTPKADEQILELDAWWRENRDNAPDLFEEDDVGYSVSGARPSWRGC